MKILILISFAAAAGMLVSCTESARTSDVGFNAVNRPATPTPEAKVPFPDVPRISLAEAKADFDAGTAVFIDTHSPATYETEHVAGSINVPATELAANIDKIPKGKKLIAYCS